MLSSGSKLADRKRPAPWPLCPRSCLRFIRTSPSHRPHSDLDNGRDSEQRIQRHFGGRRKDRLAITKYAMVSTRSVPRAPRDKAFLHRSAARGRRCQWLALVVMPSSCILHLYTVSTRGLRKHLCSNAASVVHFKSSYLEFDGIGQSLGPRGLRMCACSPPTSRHAPVPQPSFALRALLGHLEQVLFEIKAGILDVCDDYMASWSASPWLLCICMVVAMARPGDHIPSSPEAALGFFLLLNSALACSINFCLCSYSCFSCAARSFARIVRWWETPYKTPKPRADHRRTCQGFLSAPCEPEGRLGRATAAISWGCAGAGAFRPRHPGDQR